MYISGGCCCPWERARTKARTKECLWELLNISIRWNILKTGMVVDAFLSSRVFSYTVSINVDENFVDGVIKLIQTAPNFEEHGFRWPSQSGVPKFTEKKFIGNEFPIVWDGRGFKGTKLKDVERRNPIS